MSFVLTFQPVRQARKCAAIDGFAAVILADNKAMIRVFEKTGLPMKAGIVSGVYPLTIPFPDSGDSSSLTIASFEGR